MQNAGSSILVVDDEDGIRHLFRDNLEQQGYVCHTAGSGDAALEVLAAEAVDLALVDLMMPGMTGLGLFQHIKERYAEVGVVFVTAVYDLNLAVDHVKNGAYDYIVKPVTRRRLQQVVEKALDKRKALLEEKHHQRLLEDRVACQATELEAKVREFSALNRTFQSDLSKRFTAEEPAHGNGQGKHSPRSMRTLQESVNKRISEYLHGHVQSKLLVLLSRLGLCQELVSLDPDKASTLLGQIKTDLKSVQERDIRQVSHQLYHYVVRLGLVPALRSLVDRFWEAVPLDLELCVGRELQVREEFDRKLFPEEFKIAVYRIVEEALGNAVKHAHAKKATVELYDQEDGRVSLCVADDGCGFDTDEVSSGAGLFTMKDYAEALGGTCLIESTVGQGTRIRVNMPDPAITRVD